MLDLWLDTLELAEAIEDLRRAMRTTISHMLLKCRYDDRTKTARAAPKAKSNFLNSAKNFVTSLHLMLVLVLDPEAYSSE